MCLRVRIRFSLWSRACERGSACARTRLCAHTRVCACALTHNLAHARAQILEIARTASAADIKKAYRRMATRWHPDKNQDNMEEASRHMQEINEAHEVLSDADVRARYDRGEDVSNRAQVRARARARARAGCGGGACLALVCTRARACAPDASPRTSECLLANARATHTCTHTHTHINTHT